MFSISLLSLRASLSNVGALPMAVTWLPCHQASGIKTRWLAPQESENEGAVSTEVLAQQADERNEQSRGQM